MYCSTCGVAVAESLNYCNHCGARIIASNNDKVATSRHVKPELLVAAMVGTFVIGLIAITALLGVMKSVLGLQLGQILAFAVLSFLMMIFLEGVFLVLLFRRDRQVEDRARTELLAGHTTTELDAPQMQALREPLSSVTEQTTRAFEPIYTKRNKAT
jgi:low affinity Fe/Cu permease